MITGINHITFSVIDLDESFEFYKDVMMFKPVQKSPISAYLLAGQTWIALIHDDSENLKPLKEYSHIAFNVTLENFENMKERIMESGAVEWSENSTEGESFYFLDPNGHKLEIHCTDLNARIDYGKKHWGEETTWFV